MYALFDIGGTKTRVAVSEDLQSFEMPIVYDTPQDFEEGVAQLIETIEDLADGRQLSACAGGVRGVLDHERTQIHNDSILTDWVGKPLQKHLSEELNTPVYLENDTALVGLGETYYGAGMEEGIVVYHTVSSGVGGVRIIDGKIAPSEDGFEPGHQILDMDRSILGKDVPHTLENLVSGTALEKRTGKKPYDIPQDDPVWDELAQYLGFGLKNTILYWSPQRIVLGGSMIVGDPRILLPDIQRHTAEALGEGQHMPEMVLAELEDKGGLYGSMVFLRQKKA
ncbi:ROK family protein [Candidatus Kaiserbacteria bacterium]|nr:ROK family protein [Candidatus Kaiserbacteria bacterium]